jgi:hypothetical protein
MERRSYRASDLEFVMRINDQRLRQLQRGASELRVHEHAWIFRILRRDEFLRDKVHAVAQGRDKSHPRNAEKAGALSS